MTKQEALRLFIDLSGNNGEIRRPSGVRVYNFPEIIKEALADSDNQVQPIEDKMVEAIAVLVGVPCTKISIETAAS